MKRIPTQLQNKVITFEFTSDFVNRTLTKVFFQEGGILQLELANKRTVPEQKAVSKSIPQPYLAPESYKRASGGIVVPPHCYQQQHSPKIQFLILPLLRTFLHANWRRTGPWKKVEPVTQWHFSISNKLSLHMTSSSFLQEVFYCIPFAVMTSSKIRKKFIS